MTGISYLRYDPASNSKGNLEALSTLDSARSPTPILLHLEKEVDRKIASAYWKIEGWEEYFNGGLKMTRNLLEGKIVLIVDDEPDVLETLEELLSMCEVVKASTFEEAKLALETQVFDVAVLDIMGVDGYKLLEIARNRKVIPVMLTAHALSPDHTITSYKRGAALYVPKDKIVDIAEYLNDVLQAVEAGKSTWWRWLERFESYYNRKFEAEWKDKDKEFWRTFPYT
jgi:CheY-like chemotaxis protein